MNRYFEEEKGIDIISNPNFIKCNKIFQAVRGEIQLNEPISDEDMSKLSGYFVITRTSSCVNARGIPTAAYQVLHLLPEVGYPPGRGAPRPDLMEGVPKVGYP